MLMEYEDALLSPDISWDCLTQGVVIPKHLYKYQSFYSSDGSENPYWEKNMNGSFHMSLGCEFEDINDCKPFIDKQLVRSYIDKFLVSMSVEEGIRKSIIQQLDKEITEESINKIKSNYQNTIRVGCFTSISDNDKMWDKYADMKKGYCIEYDTSKNRLFEISTLPILYSDKPYDTSVTFANLLILECTKKGKQRTDEESIEIFNLIYARILKTSYVPVFIKQKLYWDFEKEYRLFLLKHRNTRDGMIKMEQFLDSSFNIDLSNSISAIYLGEDFDNNKQVDKLLKRVNCISREKNITVYRKVKVGERIINVRLE